MQAGAGPCISGQKKIADFIGWSAGHHLEVFRQKLLTVEYTQYSLRWIVQTVVGQRCLQ